MTFLATQLAVEEVQRRDLQVNGLFTFTQLPEINDGTGREVTDKISVVPGGADLALWQIALDGPGRLFHLMTTNGIGDSGTRDLIGMGVDYGGNGLLVSVKGTGGRIGKGINTAVDATAVAGSNALLVGQYNAVATAAQFEAYVATHAPVIDLIAHDAAASQKLFRVQTVAAGVYTTREYIDSQTGVHVFNAKPDLAAGATVRNTLDASVATVDQPVLRGKVVASQTANFIEFFNSASSAYLFNVTAAGRVLAPRLALNTAGATGSGQLAIFGEGSSLANAAIRAHATTPGNLTEWDDSTGAIYSRVDKGGYFMTRKVAAPADADLANGELAIWSDDNSVNFKKKTAAGAIVTGEVALA